MFNGDPLTDPSPSEVPLPSAPLVRVIAQVRFPTLVGVQQQQNNPLMAGLQEAIKEDYPELKIEQAQNITFLNEGAPNVESSVLWRFIDFSGNWRATVASDFVALETDAYISRKDFLARFGRLVSVVEAELSPKLATRLGLRYIDRLEGAAVTQIGAMARPEMLGLLGVFQKDAVRLLNEAVLKASEGQVQLRWGLMPPNATFDPAAVPPIASPSWVLDIDMFSGKRTQFAANALLGETEVFARRIYTIFRWAVTDEFLRFYGGES